jgi:hypothetical protein
MERRRHFDALHSLSQLENLRVTAHICWQNPATDVHVARMHHPLLRLIEMHFNEVNIQVTCKHISDDEANIEPHGACMRWIAKRFSRRTRQSAIRLNSLEFNYTWVLTCKQARPERVTRIGAQQVLSIRDLEL